MGHYPNITKTDGWIEGEALEVIEREKSKWRMSEGGKGGMEGVATVPPLTEKTGKTRDKVAKKVGLGSGKTYERGKKLVEAAKPEDGSESTKRESSMYGVGLHPCDCVKSA